MVDARQQRYAVSFGSAEANLYLAHFQGAAILPSRLLTHMRNSGQVVQWPEFPDHGVFMRLVRSILKICHTLVVTITCVVVCLIFANDVCALH